MAASFFIINKGIRLLFPLFVFLLRFEGENKVYKEYYKPYFQFVNLSRKVAYLIFTLLPYFSLLKYLMNNKNGYRHF